MDLNQGRHIGDVALDTSVQTAHAEFEHCYRLIYRRMVRSLIWRGADHGLAEQITQEAFLLAWTRWDQLQPYRESWIWFCARRIWWRIRERDERQTLMPNVPDSPEPTDLSDRAVSDVLLSQLLRALRPSDRKVAALRIIGHSYHEIDNILGLPGGKAVTARPRIVKQIRRALDQMGLAASSPDRRQNSRQPASVAGQAKPN